MKYPALELYEKLLSTDQDDKAIELIKNSSFKYTMEQEIRKKNFEENIKSFKELFKETYEKIESDLSSMYDQLESLREFQEVDSEPGLEKYFPSDNKMERDFKKKQDEWKKLRDMGEKFIVHDLSFATEIMQGDYHLSPYCENKEDILAMKISEMAKNNNTNFETVRDDIRYIVDRVACLEMKYKNYENDKLKIL